MQMITDKRKIEVVLALKKQQWKKNLTVLLIKVKVMNSFWFTQVSFIIF